MAPQPLPTNAQGNRGLGSGSTAGILAAIPQSTIARSHPDRTAQACTPGAQSAWASCLGGRGGGVQHPGFATQKVWAGESPSRNGLGGGHCARAGSTHRRRQALCARAACVCLKTWPAQEPAGSCPHLKGPASGWLSEALFPGLPPCPACRQAVADLIFRAACGLPFRRWPERWTGCHCSLKRAKGECPGDIRFDRQATVSVFCVFVPQFALALAPVAVQCCLLAGASPCVLFSCLWAKPSLPLLSSAPLLLCLDYHPSPLAESSLLL